MRRIVVLGGAGSGKSTFARALAARLGLSVTHLDTLYFGPAWIPVDGSEFRRRVAEAAAAGAWVIEGTFIGFGGDEAVARADLVVWLQQPALLRLWRSRRKTRIHRGGPRADRPQGCDEVFGLWYVGAILRLGAFTGKVRAELRRLAPLAEIRVLRGDREARAFLAEERGRPAESLAQREAFDDPRRAPRRPLPGGEPFR